MINRNAKEEKGEGGQGKSKVEIARERQIYKQIDKQSGLHRHADVHTHRQTDRNRERSINSIMFR